MRKILLCSKNLNSLCLYSYSVIDLFTVFTVFSSFFFSLHIYSLNERWSPAGDHSGAVWVLQSVPLNHAQALNDFFKEGHS